MMMIVCQRTLAHIFVALARAIVTTAEGREVYVDRDARSNIKSNL